MSTAARLTDVPAAYSKAAGDAAGKRNTPHILFSFESVVIVGASDEPTRIGGVPILLLKKYGFEGKIYGLNPKYTTVQGVPCFAQPEDLPEPVDMAIFCLAAEHVREMLPRLKKKGLKGAMIFSAGFGESGPEGKALQSWLTSYARENEIAVVGPNCVGQISFSAKRSLTFANPMLVFPVMEPGRITILSQSGGVAGNIWADAVLNGTRFSHVLSTGNEADLGFADFLNYLAEDETTDVVLGYIEALQDGPGFCEAARRMREKRKPLVLIKVGRSEMGRDAVSSHTGQLTSDDAGYQAAFDRYGVIRAASLQDLNDYARVFALKGLKPKITVVTTTGGTAVYVADLCADFGLELSTLSEGTERELAKIVPSFGRVRNPVDLTAQVVNNPWLLETSLKNLLADPETGVLLFLLSGKGTKEQSEQTIALFKRVQEQTSKPIVISWTATPEEVRLRAAENGLIVYQDPIRFLRPLRDYFRIQEQDSAPAAAATTTGLMRDDGAAMLDPAEIRGMLRQGESGRLVLPETASAVLLERFGIDCPKRWLAGSAAEVADIARNAPFPCVMKIVEPVIAHKSDVGGVVLGISSEREMRDAWDGMLRSLGVKQAMIAEQIDRGVEVIVGCVRDATFGMRLTVGSGGVWTNFGNDAITLIPPFDADYIRNALPRLSIWGALSGARGQEKAAIDALVDAIAGIARLGWALRGVVSEFECNPVIVTPTRAVAVDAIGFA